MVAGGTRTLHLEGVGIPQSARLSFMPRGTCLSETPRQSQRLVMRSFQPLRAAVVAAACVAAACVPFLFPQEERAERASRQDDAQTDRTGKKSGSGMRTRRRSFRQFCAVKLVVKCSPTLVAHPPPKEDGRGSIATRGETPEAIAYEATGTRSWVTKTERFG